MEIGEPTFTQQKEEFGVIPVIPKYFLDYIQLNRNSLKLFLKYIHAFTNSNFDLYFVFMIRK